MLFGTRTKRDRDHYLNVLGAPISNAIKGVEDKHRAAIALRCARVAIEKLDASHAFGTGASVDELAQLLFMVEAADKHAMMNLVEARLGVLAAAAREHLTLLRVVAPLAQFARNLAYWHAIRSLQATLRSDSTEAAARAAFEAIASTQSKTLVETAVLEYCEDRLLFF